jgi:hypothetical protein
MEKLKISDTHQPKPNFVIRKIPVQKIFHMAKTDIFFEFSKTLDAYLLHKCFEYFFKDLLKYFEIGLKNALPNQNIFVKEKS